MSDRCPYRCPLCLKVLTRADKLVRFCTHHPDQVVTLECDDDLKVTAFCPRASKCNKTIQPQGVFLRHVGCTAQNPFPDKDALKTAESIGNWQIKVLGQILERTSSSVYGSEMWFPLMLLRATAERDETGRRRGVLVGLGGARRAGKTILAMQAMDVQGYIRTSVQTDSTNQTTCLKIQDYIFSHHVEGAATNPMIETLRLRENMQRNRGKLSLPRGTQKTLGDLKAVFFKPVKELTAGEATQVPSHGDELRSGTDTPRIANGGQMQATNRALSVGRKLLEYMREAADHINFDFNTPGVITSDYWYTVALYDTAGELSERDDHLLDRLDQVLDKAAIVVDAQDIFGQGENKDENSVAVAVARLNLTSQVEHLKTCLIVTKLDCVVERMMDEWSVNIAEVAHTLGIGKSEERELLAKWLTTNKHARNNELLAFVKNKEAVDAVFFVWTENLPASQDLTEQEDQPVSHNLDRFIAWCLGVEWSRLCSKQ